MAWSLAPAGPLRPRHGRGLLPQRPPRQADGSSTSATTPAGRSSAPTWTPSSGSCWRGCSTSRSTDAAGRTLGRAVAGRGAAGAAAGRAAAAPDGRVRAPERAGPRRHGHRLPRLAAVAGPAGGPQEPAPAPATPRPRPGSSARSARSAASSTRTWSRSSPRAPRPTSGSTRWSWSTGRRWAPSAAGCRAGGSGASDVDLETWHATLSTACQEARAAEKPLSAPGEDERRSGAERPPSATAAFRRPRLRPARRRAGPPGRRGGPCAARGRRHPPRHQARQHPGDAGRVAGRADGPGPGPTGRRVGGPPHPHPAVRRHAPLRQPRAGPLGTAGPPQRRLQPGRHALGAADAAAALRRDGADARRPT